MFNILFEKLARNISEFNNEEIELLEEFVKEGFIVKNENYEINSKYRIGVLKVDKNRATLCDLANEHKNLILDFEHLNGAYDGDLVLVKRVFNPRSRVKAKVVKVFSSSSTSEILVYVKEKNFFT